MSFIILGVFCLAVSFIIWIISAFVNHGWDWSDGLLALVLGVMLFLAGWFGTVMFAGITYSNWGKQELCEPHFEIVEQTNYFLVSAGDDKYVYISPGAYNFVYENEDRIPVGINEDNVNHVTMFTDVKGESPRIEVREWHIKNKFVRGLTGDDIVYIDYILYLPTPDCVTMRGY